MMDPSHAPLLMRTAQKLTNNLTHSNFKFREEQKKTKQTNTRAHTRTHTANHTIAFVQRKCWTQMFFFSFLFSFFFWNFHFLRFVGIEKERQANCCCFHLFFHCFDHYHAIKSSVFRFYCCYARRSHLFLSFSIGLLCLYYSSFSFSTSFSLWFRTFITHHHHPPVHYCLIVLPILNKNTNISIASFFRFDFPFLSLFLSRLKK